MMRKMVREHHISFLRSNDGKWTIQFERLKVYHQVYGDTNVPSSWAMDKELGNWVKWQRSTYRQSPGKYPVDRKALLDRLGFVWSHRVMCPNRDSEYQQLANAMTGKIVQKHPSSFLSSRDRIWAIQFQRLKAYHHLFGDTKVPQRWAIDRSLGIWVFNQRRNYQKSPHGYPVWRKDLLDGLGFVWSFKSQQPKLGANEQERKEKPCRMSDTADTLASALPYEVGTHPPKNLKGESDDTVVVINVDEFNEEEVPVLCGEDPIVLNSDAPDDGKGIKANDEGIQRWFNDCVEHGTLDETVKVIGNERAVEGQFDDCDDERALVETVCVKHNDGLDDGQFDDYAEEGALDETVTVMPDYKF
jgi:Helicase associated domain